MRGLFLKIFAIFWLAQSLIFIITTTLLEVLMRSPGKVVEREALAEAVLGRKWNPFDRSLDMHVSRLRRKLATDTTSDDRVKTVRGTGYQLVLRRTLANGGRT